MSPIIAGGGSGGGLPGITVSGTAAASKALIATSASAASWTLPPGFLWDSATITSNGTSTATSAATAATIIPGHSVTYDGTAVKVIFWCDNWSSTQSSNANIIELYDGSTDVTRMWAARVESATGTGLTGIYAEYVFTPSAGAHQFIIKAWLGAAGTFTLGAGAGGAGVTPPATLQVIKV